MVHPRPANRPLARPGFSQGGAHAPTDPLHLVYVQDSPPRLTATAGTGVGQGFAYRVHQPDPGMPRFTTLGRHSVGTSQVHGFPH